jgi:hypothetical protein
MINIDGTLEYHGRARYGEGARSGRRRAATIQRPDLAYVG